MTTIDALTKFSKNINALHDFPQESSQEDFTNLMTRSFRGMYSPIEYYFNPTLNRHTVRLRDWPQISIDIIWTNTTEVAIKLTNFLKSIENMDNIDVEAVGALMVPESDTSDETGRKIWTPGDHICKHSGSISAK